MDHRIVIGPFVGEWRFLSNFYPALIFYRGLPFATSEHLFQALKCRNKDEFEAVRTATTPGKAKNLGKVAKLVDDWNEIRIPTMAHVQLLKYEQNEELLDRLKATGSCLLEERNSWDDKFWGICTKTGVGENHLGKSLMMVRRFL